MATYIVDLAARDNADNETVETKEVVANDVIITIPPWPNLTERIKMRGAVSW